MSVKDIRDQLEATRKGLLDLADQVDSEGREWRQEERDDAARRLEELKSLKERLELAEGDVRLREQIDGMVRSVDLTKEPVVPSTTPKSQSLGERFYHDERYQAWLKHIAVDGHIPDSAKGLVSPAVKFRGFKDLITGADAASAGAMVVPDQAPTVDLPRRPLTIRDVITIGSTTSDTVEFARVDTTTNAAVPVAEATATATGGDKPESAMTFERVTTTVRTIAHWLPATKRALADAGQLRTLIDAFLRAGLEEQLEDQIVTGDGVGENFTGIDNATGVQQQAWDTDLLTTTRKARTLVKVVGRATPTAYLLHPNDWERIDLLQDNEARYFFGGPSVMGQPRLWGLPVVESEAVPEGFGFVGDFRVCVLWDRQQATIQVSDSHSDFFTRNLVAILAELRAAFGILRPAALVEMDLTAV